MEIFTNESVGAGPRPAQGGFGTRPYGKTTSTRRKPHTQPRRTTMKRGFCTLMMTAALALPVTGFAASHNMDHSSMNHGSMKMDAAMVMLPMQTIDNISATVHLKDVKAVMAKMGMKHTHHFMVTFENNNGDELAAQMVAVKITGPDGKEGAPVELMAMEGHAGADVILATPGAYKFKVAAKLADGKKVQYEFSSTIK